MKFSEQIVTRFKSLLWRIGAMALALIIQFLLDNLSGFNLGPQVTVTLGLVLGEISKWVNNYMTRNKA